MQPGGLFSLLVLAFSTGLAASDSPDEHGSGDAVNAASGDAGDGLSGGAVAGIVIGSIAGVAFIGLLVWWYMSNGMGSKSGAANGETESYAESAGAKQMPMVALRVSGDDDDL